MSEKEECRKSFNNIAEQYDQIRPSYPEQLVNDIIAKTNYHPDDWMLEVGCGSGQATKMFAQRGCKVLAVEPGENLERIARRNIADYPDCKVEIARFEDWDSKNRKFQVLYAATSYHWVQPEVKYTKPVEVLSDDGWIALFWNNRLAYAPQFKSGLDAIYDSYSLQHCSGQSKKSLNELFLRQEQDILNSGNFKNIQTIEYPWYETHDANSYIRLIDTFSHHQVLEPAIKENLYTKIKTLISTNGDQIEIPYLAALTLAQKY